MQAHSFAAPLRQSRAAAEMKAAVLVGPRLFALRTLPVPGISPDEVLIRVQGCGVCASNVPPFEGRPWFQYPMEPGALGHEGWGIVESTGAAVQNLAAGDRVAMLSQRSFAEFDLAEPNCLVPLPDSLADRPFPAEPIGCAINIFKRSTVKPGDTVAIVGIGFLGALLTQLVAKAGSRVIAISRKPSALDVARRMGATHGIVAGEESQVIDDVEVLTRGRLCDVVIEAAGKQAPLDLAAKLTRVRGRLIIAGYHQDGSRQVNMQLWNWRGLDVINAHERDPEIYRSGVEEGVRTVESGLLDPDHLYTHRFPLSRIADALAMTAARPDGFVKALILN